MADEQFTFSTREDQKEQDLTLEEVLGQAVGAGSVCWNPRPAGEFDSSRAKAVVDRAVALLRERTEVGPGVAVTGVWLHKNFPHLEDGKLDLYVEFDGEWHHIQSHEHPDQSVISHITEVAGLRGAPVWDPDAEMQPYGWTKGPGTPQQINELAEYLVAEWGDQIQDDASAVEMAIRLLRNTKRTLKAMQDYGSGSVNVRQVINLLTSDTVNESN